MSQFQVDSTQVAAASTAVQTSAERIGAEVDGMMRHLLDLQASWHGNAAVSFQQVVTQWRSTQEQVRAALEGIRVALAAAGRGYEEAEAAAMRMFSGS
jgi:6 kDa early secretory antigenic target